MAEHEMSPIDRNLGIEPMQPIDNGGMPFWVLLSGGMDSAACIEFYKKRADIVSCFATARNSHCPTQGFVAET